ncbi:hypothetical protein, partial [Streptomyces sp. WAC08241]|uniref:hypothetical protein n=1 Tax=Streptomyces sp. WAC08241 TaxID=2487421 RepID=UPI000FACA34A
MSVYSPARNTPALADYNKLGPTHQAHFDSFMEQADNTRDATTYAFLMAAAALAAGIPLPASGEITKCACPHCYCTAIFDTHTPGLIVVETSTYNLPRLQCTDCADDHPTPVQNQAPPRSAPPHVAT